MDHIQSFEDFIGRPGPMQEKSHSKSKGNYSAGSISEMMQEKMHEAIYEMMYEACKYDSDKNRQTTLEGYMKEMSSKVAEMMYECMHDPRVLNTIANKIPMAESDQDPREVKAERKEAIYEYLNECMTGVNKGFVQTMEKLMTENMQVADMIAHDMMQKEGY